MNGENSRENVLNVRGDSSVFFQSPEPHRILNRLSDGTRLGRSAKAEGECANGMDC